ncbi:MAG: flagellar hook-associated family protein [Pseudomonadota bacterium]
MQTSYISTAALRGAPRAEILRIQNELTDRSIEVATSRHADVGVSLGTGTGRTVETRMDFALIETLRVSNASATARLSQTQSALTDIEEVSSEMLASLVALPPGSASARTLEIQAISSLDRVADRLNASDGGSYLFGGINSDQPPFNRFDTGPQAAVESAFLARFGVAVNDPGAAAITAVDMADFLANAFADLFNDPAWGATWSSASYTNLVSRIDPSERIETSTNANEEAIRKTVMGLTMIAGLGIGGLNEATRKVVTDQAILTVGGSITDVVALKAALGFAENAVQSADRRMALASDILEERIVTTERADPVEAKVRIDLLTTQLEMSFALTNQLSRLSILNYV